MRLNDQRAPGEQPSKGGLLQLLLNAQAMSGAHRFKRASYSTASRASRKRHDRNAVIKNAKDVAAVGASRGAAMGRLQLFATGSNRPKTATLLRLAMWLFNTVFRGLIQRWASQPTSLTVDAANSRSHDSTSSRSTSHSCMSSPSINPKARSAFASLS